MFEFDATFFALVGLVLFIILIVYLRVPGMIGKALDKRSEVISAELDEAKRLREEAAALLAEYKKKAMDAESEARTIVDQARREAASLAAEAETRMADYVTRRTKIAEDKIAQAEHQALQEVKALSADVAIAAAERLLSSKVKGPVGDDLVTASIADVRTRLN